MGRVVLLRINKTGFTLVEVMIALVISLVIGLALMQTAIVGIDSNMINVLRDEAVNIAERKVSDARNVPFDSIVPDTSTVVTSSMRNIISYPYTVTQTVIQPTGSDVKVVTIEVKWDWKDKTVANGNAYTHTITTVVRKP